MKKPFFKPRRNRPQGQGAGKPPSIQEMDRLLKKSQIELSSFQLDQLWRFHNLLRKRNDDRELTRITGFEPMVIKHYVDCMIVGAIHCIPSPVVDVGTGAGFPGIPLKIRYPNLHMILAEPRPKRIAFLKEAIKELGLKNVSVFEHKVVSRSFQIPVQAVITRAVETMDKTLLRTSASLVKGGELIFLKGPNVDPEIRDIQKRFGKNYQLKLNEDYALPHTEHDRRLVVWERLTEPVIPIEKPRDDEDERDDSQDSENEHE